jgi:malonyl CoA-acyl carrier protein transacylase
MGTQPSTAALFPGQGSSLAGAAPLIARHCQDLHAYSRELLGCDPLDHAGQSTRYAQPAIFLASLAGWRAAAACGLDAGVLAGHSLGELTALTVAGAWSEVDGLRLVVRRAALMADAADDEDGGMLALLGGEPARALALAERFEVTVANDNAPGQAVLSGHRPALREASRAARIEGIRAIALDVTGAFHSPAMLPAVEPFADAVRAVAPAAPSPTVISGCTAQPFGDVAAELGAAIGATVRWREVMLELARMGVERYADVGPDVILARLARRNIPHCAVVTTGALDEAA